MVMGGERAQKDPHCTPPLSLTSLPIVGVLGAGHKAKPHGSWVGTQVGDQFSLCALRAAET